MKKAIVFIYIIHISFCAASQSANVDSLTKLLSSTAQDTNRVNILLALADQVYFYTPETSLQYSKQALSLSRKLNYLKGIAAALNLAGEASRITGNYPDALRMQIEAADLFRKMKNPTGEAGSLGFIGVNYMGLSEHRKALHYLLKAKEIQDDLPVTPPGIFTLVNIANSYHFLEMPDSALFYLRLAKTKNSSLKHPQLSSYILRSLGSVHDKAGNVDSALHYFYEALKNSRATNESINLGVIQQRLAESYNKLLKFDSAFFYARNAFSEANRTSQKSHLLTSSSFLARMYRNVNKLDSAFYYEDIATAMKDSLYGNEAIRRLQLLMLEEQQKQLELQQKQERYRNNTKIATLLSAIAVVLIIAFILYRNNRQKQKTNTKLNQTLSDLKSTQSQLIQSEKMASLGELTAGIAHEIQNPLNFVNNFSDVNSEMIDEANQEIDRGNLSEAKAILKDLKENQDKINHHGKRADTIVKGMLQHSRSSSGQKEATDINALCDQYLRLAYHGLKAKDKIFAKFETQFDNTIEKINIVPQDIGRVVLNLINNAFYAVNERLRQAQPDSHYEPTVTVSTKRIKDKVEISVNDNGNGIPESIKEKIFQPFFTTKPTGSGTGLGLSLSYDIVKAHGGEIKVKSKLNEGTEFKIYLPI